MQRGEEPRRPGTPDGLRAGAVPRSARRATVEDVAQHAGVSQSTASRALSGRGYVSERALARVRQAVTELGYVPNDIARSLKGQSTRVIGMVVDSLSQTFFAEVAAGIETVLRSRGYRLFLAASGGESQDESAALHEFEAIRADGVIVAPAAPDSAAIVKSVISHGVPVVEVDRRTVAGLCDAVLLQNEMGGYLATKHLLDFGHIRIGVIAGSFTTGGDRLAGYRRALQEAGIEFDDRLVVRTTFHPADPAAVAGALLDANPDATAVFTTNNVLASGVVMAARARRCAIPGDVSLVGFDDEPWMSFLDPTLTTVAQPTREIGRQAAQLLVDRIEGRLQDPPVTLLLEPRLIVRQSTAPPRQDRVGRA